MLLTGKTSRLRFEFFINQCEPIVNTTLCSSPRLKGRTTALCSGLEKKKCSDLKVYITYMGL